MKPGDLIQIRQVDVVPMDHEPKTVSPGRRDVWIYAHVISVVLSAPAGPEEASAATGVLAQVAHPGNRLHGRQLTVPLADTRTQADVLALAAMATDAKQKTHLQRQAAHLAPPKVKPKPAAKPAPGGDVSG